MYGPIMFRASESSQFAEELHGCIISAERMSVFKLHYTEKTQCIKLQIHRHQFYKPLVALHGVFDLHDFLDLHPF